jgi:hypothetical protein
MKIIALPFLQVASMGPYGNETRLALIRLSFSGDINPDGALAKLLEAVTVWVETTPDGQKCWADSDETLSIDNLLGYDNRFADWIKSRIDPASSSIQLLNFEILYVGIAGERSVPYDMLLVNRKGLL